MSKPHPADELAEIRSALARLRLREAQLRDLLVTRPELGTKGRFARANVTLHCDRILDPTLLPTEIRDDPRYYRTRHHWSVHSQSLPCQTGPRPGWPIRRGAEVALH